MGQPSSGRLALAAAAVTAAACMQLPHAGADPGAPVFPGMEIRQDTSLCTLGYVDVATRTGYTAGHCRGSGAVTNSGGGVVGTQTAFSDNTPNGATVSTDHVISDWETISFAPGAALNNALPGGRPLVVDGGVVPTQGQRVCHFGVVTGESCGTIESVNNGWFTMTNGVVSQRGDSGGPVYVPMDDGRAALVGIFNSTWGALPAAVSWSTIDQQSRGSVVSTASGGAPE